MPRLRTTASGSDCLVFNSDLIYSTTLPIRTYAVEYIPSSLGHMSTVTPYVRTAPAEFPMASDRTPHILVVEDNPDTQLLLRYLLRPHFEAEIVSHVDEALEVARKQDFDLLVLDINLGENRTGIDLLQELRLNDAYRSTPALALTAYAMPGDRERFQSAGFTQYISKPFTRKELYEALNDMLGRS